MHKKIKIEVTCRYFSKWYDSSNPVDKKSQIEFDSDIFSTIKYLKTKEIPYENTYLTLDESDGNHRFSSIFFKEIHKFVSKKYNFVIKIDFVSDTAKIYSSNLKYELSSTTIFEIPQKYIKKSKDVLDANALGFFFKPIIFSTIPNTMYPVSQEYIGYTGNLKNNLEKGVEIKCEITLESTQKPIYCYIYIILLHKIQKKGTTRNISEYYIFRDDVEEQASNQFIDIITENIGVQKIRADCIFFDDSILEFVGLFESKFDFDSKIEYYYELSYEKTTGVKLIQKLRQHYRGYFIESNKIL